MSNQTSHPRLSTTNWETFTITVIAPSRKQREGSELADYVRTVIGPLVKELDLPRIHSMAEGGTILLHGVVSSEADAQRIEECVAAIPGVDSVQSHLHVGLLSGDHRPSYGSPEQSPMYAALMGCGESIGIVGPAGAMAAQGTLSAVIEQIPIDERAHVIAHLPADVVALLTPRRVIGSATTRWKTELALDADAALRSGVTVDDAAILVPEVIGVLRRFVPEEDADVQKTLKHHLRELWEQSIVPPSVSLAPPVYD